MSRRLPIGMLTLLSLSLSCQRFKDRFDSVATLCGVEPASIQADELFVKLESPQGEELSAETLLTTRSRFLLPTRSSQTLNISARGCVRVPTASGVLQAFSSAQGWSVAQALEPVQGHRFLRIPMQTSPRVSAELQCPTQGFFAHKDLPFPLRWTSDGILHATRFEMTAYDESQQKSFVLFEKPYGLHLTELPQNLPTEHLPEGQYQLRLTFQVSTEGWDVPGFIPTRTESCPLTVLHHRPELGGLDGYSLDDRVAVFAKGEILPWKTPSPQSDLLYCSEKRGQDLDEGVSPEAEGECRPRAACQDVKNFRKSGALVAEETGVFDYYAYAEDKAGNRSSMSCQTLVITDKKPDLQLLWSEADWNKPSAQMRTPRADVQLRIAATHPQLEDATLASRYQCKAEFVREDQSIVSGRAVICTSGRCQNQSMENYVPCDPNITLSIVDLWPYMKATGGDLRVFVKADDRAGHIEERIATVGIQPERWKPTRWSATMNVEDTIFQMLQDRQGRIFTSNWNQVFERDELQEKWKEWTRPTEVENGSITRAWFSQEGELHVGWKVTLPSSSQPSYPIFRMTENGWQRLPTWDAQDLLECRNPQVLNRGGFWCSTTQGVAFHVGGAWTIAPYPTAEDGADCETLPQRQFFGRDQAQTLWLSCNNLVFQKPPHQNKWSRVEHPLPLVKMAIDAKDRVWIVRGSDRHDLTVLMVEAGATRILPKPESFQWIDLRPQYFVIGPSAEIILGDSYWDDSKGQWQVFPYFVHKHPDQRVTPQFSGRGELIWTTEKGLLQWDGERLRDWDVSVHDLNISPYRVQLAVGRDGLPWVLASPGGSYEFPYQFHQKKWAYFPKPNLSPSSNIAGFWVDRQSKARIYIPNDGLYTLDSAGWIRSLRSPGLNEEIPLESAAFEPTILSSQGIYHWTPAQDWTPMVRFPEPRSYWGGTRDAQGRFWVYQDSMELGVIDGSSFSSVSLGSDSGSWVKGIFASGPDIVVATDMGLLSRSEGQTEWSRIPWQDFGLETIDRVRQIDDQTFFVSVTEASEIREFWMLDLKTKTKKSFAVPSPAYFLGNIRKTSLGEYIVAIKFDVFRTDGVIYTKIFSQDELYSLPTVSGTFLNVFRLQLDANDRVWFDTGYGVIRIDLY